MIRRSFLVLICLLLNGNNLFAQTNLREKLTGPVIATGDSYTIHSPDVEWKNNLQMSCPSKFSANPILTQQERLDALQRNWDYQKEHKEPIYAQWKELLDKNMEQMNRVPSLLHQHKTITQEESQKLLNELILEQKQHKEWMDLEYKRIEREADAQMPPEANPIFNLYVLHTPRDPNATIIPLNGNYPTVAFNDQLNKDLQPLFKNCADIETVIVNHFYRDAFRNETIPGGWERAIVHHTYKLRSKRLELVEHVVSKGASGVDYWYDPKQNTDLTLASFLAKKKEVARYNADYRKDFYSADKRQAGIVYKLDDYWQKYNNFDVARRIFDGDFKGFSNTIEFRVLFSSYAELFSSQCKEHVGEFVKYRIPSSEKVSTTYYMDGHSESEFRDTYYDVYIDQRFTPQWSDYQPDVAKYMLMSALEKGNKHGNLMDLKTDELGNFIKANMEEWLMYQMIKFFQNHTCESAVIQQMGENFERAANQRASLQEEKVELVNAKQESDPPRALPEIYQDAQLFENRRIAGEKLKQEEQAKLEEQKALRALPIPPKDIATLNKFLETQTKRDQYFASKTTGNVPNTINFRKKNVPLQSTPSAQEQYEASIKQKRAAVQANTKNSSQPQSRRGGSVKSDNPTDVIANVENMQTIAQEHAQLIQTMAADFQKKMSTAKTAEERRRLQVEFQKQQQEATVEYQKKIQSMQGGRARR